MVQRARIKKQLECVKAIPNIDMKHVQDGYLIQHFWERLWYTSELTKRTNPETFTFEDYLNFASPLSYFGKYNVRTLILHAADDPLVPPDCLYACEETIRGNPNMIVCISATGGHCGFRTGESWSLSSPTATWAERSVAEYFTALSRLR